MLFEHGTASGKRKWSALLSEWKRNDGLVFFCFVLVVGVKLIDWVYYCIVEVVKLATELLEVVEQVAILIFYTVLM